jgi:hypothetical protein
MAKSTILFANADDFIEFVNDLEVLGLRVVASSIFEWHHRVPSS